MRVLLHRALSTDVTALCCCSLTFIILNFSKLKNESHGAARNLGQQLKILLNQIWAVQTFIVVFF